MSVGIAFIYFTCVFLFVFIVAAVIKSGPTASLRSDLQHGTNTVLGVLDLWIIT